MEHRKHEVPIFIMAMDSPGEDQKVASAMHDLSKWLQYPDVSALRDSGLVQRNVGVNAYAWPHNIDIATHAASSLMAGRFLVPSSSPSSFLSCSFSSSSPSPSSSSSSFSSSSY